MKKNVIAALLSVVLAAGSIGTTPVFAAETTSEEAVAVEEEESLEEEASKEIENADTGLTAGDVSEEETTQAEDEESVEEEWEAEESAEEQGESADIVVPEETTGVEEMEDHADEGKTSAEVIVSKETAAIEEKTGSAEENEANGTEMVIDFGSCGRNATWMLTGSYDDLTLTISGESEINDYRYEYGYYEPSDDPSAGGWYEDSDAPWFEDEVNKLVINEGITYIGSNAFAGMVHLKSITIPSSVTYIGDRAFYRCEGLANITIPNSVREIGGGAFSNCSSLKSIKLPSKLKYVGGGAFSDCSSLTNITMANGVIEIGSDAFRGCSSLTNITMSNNVIEIGVDTFKGCSNLKSITLPSKLRYIGNGAFFGCSSLTNITFPNTVRKIGDGAFSGCSSLTTITIPDTMWEIREEAFSGCSSLTSITIPAGVRLIGNQAFSGCESLNIFFDGSDKRWGAINESDKAEYKTITFSVNSGTFSVDADFNLPKTAYNYTGNQVKPSVTVIYNGNQLVQDKDYNLMYENNINIGTATVNVNGIGSYSGTATLQFRIRLGNPPKVTCTNVASGMKVSWEKVSGATRYKVYRDDKLIFTTSALVVTDKEVKYKGGTKFVYKVVATEKNAGDSDLSKTAKYYRLMPVGIKSLSNTSAGKMTVTYDKSPGCYGYVVRYGLKKDMSDARVITVQGQNTTSRTFGGMKKGKTYYVQVRTYKLDNGVRYYSGYCTTKTITIKK